MLFPRVECIPAGQHQSLKATNRSQCQIDRTLCFISYANHLAQTQLWSPESHSPSEAASMTLPPRLSFRPLCGNTLFFLSFSPGCCTLILLWWEEVAEPSEWLAVWTSKHRNNLQQPRGVEATKSCSFISPKMCPARLIWASLIHSSGSDRPLD